MKKDYKISIHLHTVLIVDEEIPNPAHARALSITEEAVVCTGHTLVNNSHALEVPGALYLPGELLAMEESWAGGHSVMYPPTSLPCKLKGIIPKPMVTNTVLIKLKGS